MNADYVRTTGGRTVHRADCPTALRVMSATPWHWANGKTREQIERETAALGVTYRWCSRCFGTDEP